MFPQPFQVVLAPVKTPADRCPATKKSDCDTYQHFCQIVSFLSVASIIRDLPEIMNQFFCLDKTEIISKVNEEQQELLEKIQVALEMC